MRLTSIPRIFRKTNENFFLHSIVVAFSLFIVFFSIDDGFAQDNEQKQKLFINYEFMNDIDFGGYNVSGLSSRAFKIPLSYTYDFGKNKPYFKENKALGIKFMVDFNFGKYKFRGTIDEGMRARAEVDAISIIPGIQLRIPVRPYWLLRPFIKGGFGWGNVTRESPGIDASSPLTYAYELGIKNNFFWDWKSFKFSYGNTLSTGGNGTFDGDQTDFFAKFKNGIESRHPLGFKIKSQIPDFGGYFTYTRYIPDTDIPIINDDFTINDQFEIGGSIGLATRVKVKYDSKLSSKILNWPLKLLKKRLVVGYRFGDGVKGVIFRLTVPL